MKADDGNKGNRNQNETSRYLVFIETICPDKHVLSLNFILFFRTKIVLSAEQDYKAWILLLILNYFFRVSYKDNLNESLILLCKEFENNTPLLTLLNNHNIFDGKTIIFKTHDTIQHRINFKKTLEKIKNCFVRTT